MEDCFNDICPFGASYERAKDYSRAEFDVPDAPTTGEVKQTRTMLQMWWTTLSEQVFEEQEPLYQ